MEAFQIWTLIITALGSVGTVGAVIVALWQSKFNNRKKIKLKISTVAQVVQDARSGKFEEVSHMFFVLDAVNIGNRDVIITSWGLCFSNNFKLQILNIEIKQFPVKIGIEESFSLKASILQMRNTLLQHENEIKRMKQKLKFYVTDTTGKMHKIKLNKTCLQISQMKDDEIAIKHKQNRV